MLRTARIVIPNYPHHIIQRGHNRQTVFTEDTDYLYYLENLAEWKKHYNCKVYAYCLMTNHVHLLIDPGNEPEALGKLMKRLAGRQTRFVNRQEGRSGTLWEGHLKSSPVDTNNYLLVCSRYIEMNPVFAGMVSTPETYRWSSCAAKVGQSENDWLDLDPLYLGLGATETERREKYRLFLKQTVTEEERSVILGAAQRGQLTGDDSFVDEIEKKLALRIELRKQGRPLKVPNK